MNPTDEVAAKTEPTERQSPGAVAGSDDVLRKFDERFHATLTDRQRTSNQRKPVEDLHNSDVELNERLDDLPRPSPQRKLAEDVQNILSQISQHLDYEASERTTIYHRLLAIENEVKKLGFSRYLVAICISAAAILAWQSYGAATKQVIATMAPELGWSPETKQMIASWVQQLGWTKPLAGQESTAVRSSVPETPQSALIEQAAPEAVAPKARATASFDLQKVQQIEADIAAVRQTVEQLTAVRQTVEQLWPRSGGR